MSRPSGRKTGMPARMRKKRKNDRNHGIIKTEILSAEDTEAMSLEARHAQSVFKTTSEIQNCPNSISSCGKYFVSSRGLKQHNRHDRPCYDCVTLKNLRLAMLQRNLQLGKSGRFIKHEHGHFSRGAGDDREFVGIGTLRPPWRDRIRRIVEQVRSEDQSRDKSLRCRRKLPTGGVIDASGVSYADGRWRAELKVEDRQLYLASFKSVEAAMLAVHRTHLVLCIHKDDEKIGYNALESVTEGQDRECKQVLESRWNHKLIRREYLVEWEPKDGLPLKTWEARDRLLMMEKFKEYEIDRFRKYRLVMVERNGRIVLNKTFQGQQHLRNYGRSMANYGRSMAGRMPPSFGMPGVAHNPYMMPSHQPWPLRPTPFRAGGLAGYPGYMGYGGGLKMPGMPMAPGMSQFAVPGMQSHLRVNPWMYAANGAQIYAQQQMMYSRKGGALNPLAPVGQLPHNQTPLTLPGGVPNAQGAINPFDKQAQRAVDQAQRPPDGQPKAPLDGSPTEDSGEDDGGLAPVKMPDVSSKLHDGGLVEPENEAPDDAPPPVADGGLAKATAVQNIFDVLKDLELTEYQDTFAKQHIGVEELLMMEQSDLQQLIPHMGPRIRLRTWIRKTQREREAAGASPPTNPDAAPRATLLPPVKPEGNPLLPPVTMPTG